MKIEDWYMDVVQNNYGIWLGGDVGSQTVINFNGLTSDDRMVNNPDYCFAAEKGKKTMVKRITYKEDEDEENE